MLILAILIAFATIYGRYHFAIDTVAGLALALVGWGLSTCFRSAGARGLKTEAVGQALETSQAPLWGSALPTEWRAASPLRDNRSDKGKGCSNVTRAVVRA